MKLWHINDRGTRITGSAVTPILKTDSMELGTGNMDLDSLMAQALAVEVDAVILESHRNWVDNSPIKSFQLSAKYLKQHGKNPPAQRTGDLLFLRYFFLSYIPIK